MSLLDTIKGARAEAEEAGTLLSAKKDAKDAAAKAEDEGSSQAAGFSRRSAARAKPTREVAGSVRGAGSSTGEKTKDEKKAEREKRRTESDLRYDTTQAVLAQQDHYELYRRIWWGLIIAGMLCTIASWLLMRHMQKNGIEDTVMLGACIALMVLAYALIIGDFIFDYVKIRPLRKKAEAATAGMSQKRMRRVLADEEAKKNTK